MPPGQEEEEEEELALLVVFVEGVAEAELERLQLPVRHCCWHGQVEEEELALLLAPVDGVVEAEVAELHLPVHQHWRDGRVEEEVVELLVLLEDLRRADGCRDSTGPTLDDQFASPSQRFGKSELKN